MFEEALEFPDGQLLLVSYLLPGQRARVLQLPLVHQVGAHHNPLLQTRGMARAWA